MFLTASQSALLAWSLAAVVIGAAAVAGVALMRRGSRIGLPIILVGVLAGLAVANLPWINGTAVLVVMAGDGKAVRKDLALYGSAAYRFADGSSEELRWNSATELVLNDTPVPMTISKVQYGVTWAEPNRTPLDPYRSVKLEGHIDHFGPEDLPPQTSEKWERYWLRW